MALVDYARDKGIWTNIPALITESRSPASSKMILFPEAIQRKFFTELGALNTSSDKFYYAEIILPKPHKIREIKWDGVLPSYFELLYRPSLEGQLMDVMEVTGTYTYSHYMDRQQDSYKASVNNPQIQHIIIIARESVVGGELVIPKLYSVHLIGDEKENISGDNRTGLPPNILATFSFSRKISTEEEVKDSTIAMNLSNGKEVDVAPEVRDADSFSLPEVTASVFKKQNSLIIHEKAGVGAWFGSGNDDFGISFKSWNGDFGNEFRLQVIGVLQESNALSQSSFGTMGLYRAIKRLPRFGDNLIEGGSFYPYGALGFGLGFITSSNGDDSSTTGWLYGIDATAGISFFYKNFEVSLDVLGFGYAGESTEGSGSNGSLGRTNPTLSICYYWK